MSRSLVLGALTGMCAGVFVLAINAGTLSNIIGALCFGLGFATASTVAIDKLEQNK